MTPNRVMWTEPPVLDLDAMTRAEDYVMEDQDLGAAANAAVILGKPLLLTGEAGVGKSQFASWLAMHLKLGEPLKFVVKSTTEARDLFYQYDALARFHEAQITQREPSSGGETNHASRNHIDSLRYLTYNALGVALLYLIGKETARDEGLISEVVGELFEKFPVEPRQSVVLIDEIDKAPRDVPNDILDEILNWEFTIRELGSRRVKAPIGKRPVVIMTSNSERDFPKPFLRRCVYYDMKPPSPMVLAKIVDRRVGKRFARAGTILDEAMALFTYLRDHVGLRQRPGVAELLDFLSALGSPKETNTSLLSHPDLHALIKGTLLKDQEDHKMSDRDWTTWINKATGKVAETSNNAR